MLTSRPYPPGMNWLGYPNTARKPGTACRAPTTPESRPNSKLAMEIMQHIARHFQFATSDDVVSFASAMMCDQPRKERRNRGTWEAVDVGDETERIEP